MERNTETLKFGKISPQSPCAPPSLQTPNTLHNDATNMADAYLLGLFEPWREIQSVGFAVYHSATERLFPDWLECLASLWLCTNLFRRAAPRPDGP